MNKKNVILVRNCHDISLAQLPQEQIMLKKRKVPKKTYSVQALIPNFLYLFSTFCCRNDKKKYILNIPVEQFSKKKKHLS